MKRSKPSADGSGGSGERSGGRSPTRAVVVAAADARPREYLGVSLDLLAVGERAMVTRMRFQTGANAPKHTHPHEQVGYVVSGRYRQTIAGTIHELHPGDSYAIPGGIEHAMEVLEDGQVIDVFTPPRDEFR